MPNPSSRRPRQTRKTGTAAGPRAEGLIGLLLTPVRRLARRQADMIERVLLGEIRHMREDLDEIPAAPTETPAHASRTVAETDDETPMALLRTLLDRSMEQTQEECETAYFVTALKMLVPDEVRILSALSDGAAHPLIHVAVGSRLGGTTRLAARNISSIGKVAGVQWIEQTPTYISRLQMLGLVETGAEDASLAVKYQILETDSAVLRAAEQARKTGARKTAIKRLTLKISPLGQTLWDACQP